LNTSNRGAVRTLNFRLREGLPDRSIYALSVSTSLLTRQRASTRGIPAAGDAGRPQQNGSTPDAPGSRVIRVEILDPLRITARGQEIRGGLRKARELLAFLAVHPDGVTGEAISEALWPESPPGRGATLRCASSATCSAQPPG
jgi:hypothetical protein